MLKRNTGVKKFTSFLYFTGEEQPAFYDFYHMKKSL
jgi:hypothetical protein